MTTMRHRISWAAALAATLIIAALLATTASAPVAAGAGPAATPIYQSWPAPGIYVFFDYTNMKPSQYPFVTGGHEVATWSTIEQNRGQFDWGWLDRWIADNAALGKPVGLGFNTYDGQCCSPPNGHWLPQWFMTQYPDGYINCDGVILPKYWSESYLAAFGDWIAEAARRYDNDPRVAWIEISSGIYGETKPAENDFNTCLQAAGLTSDLWVTTVNRITDLYLSLWHTKPLLIQYAPWYLDRRERRSFTDYAGARGVGMKHNKLLVDHDDQVIDKVDYFLYRAGQYDPMFTFAGQVPTSWEAYRMFFQTPSDTLWGFLNGMNKHPTYVLVTRDLLITTDPLEKEVLAFANRYAGRTLQDTPSVWIALRETLSDWYPQRGNFDFWLYQNDAVAGGKTVPAWNVTSAPQGRYTRRTDQATGNPYMFFDIDDGYLFGATAPVTITVTYLDRGNDTWELHYDGDNNHAQLAGRVQKTNSNQWRKVTFVLADARLANGMAGASDFRIGSAGDGDEYIHFVDVQKSGAGQAIPPPSPTPGPTPTPTPTPAPPQPPSIVNMDLMAPYVEQTMAIDGNLDDWPAGATALLDRDTAGYVHPRSNPDPADASARLRVAWDRTGLYIGAVITDSQQVADSSDIWRDDSIEVSIDGAHDEEAGGADDHQFTVAVDGRLTDFGAGTVSGATVAVKKRADRYTVELFVPLAALGVPSLSSDQVLGFNFGLHDDDDGGDWDSYLVLFGANTNYSGPDWGDLHLLPPTENDVGGRTWYDLNANGVIDPTEQNSLSGVVIGILDANGQVVTATQSDDNGQWLVQDLPPGVYRVIAENPPGAYATSPSEVVVALPYDGTVNFGFLGSTAVVVQRVDIEAQPDTVTLRWQTSFEVDNRGFRVLRRENESGVLKPITLAPLPSRATPGAGASYQLTDPNVAAGHRYAYWIESVPGDTLLGPFSTITPLRREPRRNFLPLISD